MNRMYTNLLICVLLLSAPGFAGGATAGRPKQDSSWKRYANKDFGYCVDYPAKWARDNAFDGAGMYFETGLKKFSMPIGEMDVNASPSPEGLAETVDVHLQGLRKFQRAQKMEVLDRREVILLGAPALLTKDRYFDPLDGAKWVNEMLLTRHNKLLYRLELVCRADHLDRFEAAFSRFVGTFKFDCNAKRR